MIRSIAFLAAAIAGAAAAADLQVAPVSIQFAAADRAQSLWLTNSGAAPLHAQVRVYRWTQQDGEDRLEPARELVASPPIMNIAAGQSQLVRVVRRHEPAAGVEEAYRVIVDELPTVAGATAPASGDTALAGRPALAMLLRYSIPAFLGTPGDRSAGGAGALKAAWVARPVPVLTVENGGARRVRISRVVHEDAGGTRTDLVPGLLGYVLAGRSMRWEMPQAAASLGPGVIKARLNEALDEVPIATAVRP